MKHHEILNLSTARAAAAKDPTFGASCDIGGVEAVYTPGSRGFFGKKETGERPQSIASTARCMPVLLDACSAFAQDVV